MKQERHATTLAEDLQEASANTAEYGEFFTGLTGITDRNPSTTHWASEYRTMCSAGSRGIR